MDTNIHTCAQIYIVPVHDYYEMANSPGVPTLLGKVESPLVVLWSPCPGKTSLKWIFSKIVVLHQVPSSCSFYISFGSWNALPYRLWPSACALDGMSRLVIRGA